MHCAKPIRVLHVVGGMNRGGVESWLMHVLRHADRHSVAMDFAVHTTSACAYDDEIRSLGARIIPCLTPQKPLAYRRRFLEILQEYGPYDVVHSHVHRFSGFILRTAHHAGVRLRIAHGHTDRRVIDSRVSLLRRGYLQLMQAWIRTYATHGFACSAAAARSLYGDNWESTPKWRVLSCGIELEPFRQPYDASEVRAEFGIKPDAFVLGHVGRFVKSKNHEFLVDVAREVIQRRNNACLLLVGDGPLRDRVQARAATMGIGDKVVFAGLRPDVARVMVGAMDAFVFPSEYEGLGIVLVEAQAAGVPVLFTDSLPFEIDVVPSLIRRESLEEPAAAWAEALLEHYESARAVSREVALDQVERSAFNIGVSVSCLARLYCS